MTAITAADASTATTDAAVRSLILDGMISALRLHPLHEVTVPVVAKSAGMSESQLSAVFPTWDGLLLATIDEWAGWRTNGLMPLAEQFGTIRFLRAIVAVNLADPALMRFLTATLSISATPDHRLAPMLHARWRRFYAFVRHSLERDISLGREPHTMEPARGAEQLISSYEGLQLQFMVRPEMDLLDSFDRAVTRLRDGWSREYIAPIWNLGAAS